MLIGQVRLQPGPLCVAQAHAGQAGLCLGVLGSASAITRPLPGRVTVLIATELFHGPVPPIVIGATRSASQVRHSTFSAPYTKISISYCSSIRSHRFYILILGCSKYTTSIKISQWNRHWNPLLALTPRLCCVLTPVISVGVEPEPWVGVFYVSMILHFFYYLEFIVREINT